MIPRKGQKCHKCKKPIGKDWAYNGKWWCWRCKKADSAKRIIKYLKENE